MKDCETQFWYILIREWSYAGISHDQSTPGDVFPSPNTQKNDDYEPSMWNSFFPKSTRDQHESQVDITGSPCHLACSSASMVFSAWLSRERADRLSAWLSRERADRLGWWSSRRYMWVQLPYIWHPLACMVHHGMNNQAMSKILVFILGIFYKPVGIGF